MYQPGRVLIIGGSGGYGALAADGSRAGEITNTTELIDLNIAGTGFRPGPPMQYPRHHVNSTLLPDGSVLVTGGGRVYDSYLDTDAVLPAELWRPPSPGYPDGRWTTLAAMQVPRLYHSTAVLLPDGRVLSAGGGNGGPAAASFIDHPDAEIFSPPYLFATSPTPRPSIGSAPAAVGYGTTFAVQTPASADVARVTLVRLTSVTHSINMNQRFVEMSFTRPTATSLAVVAPSNANCPPGQYLMFLLDAQGIPSVGRVITVDVNACAPVVSFVEATQVKGKCWETVRITASGSNLGTNPQWYVDGVLQNVPAGQTYVDISLWNSTPARTYALAVTPPCGGAVATVGGTVTRNPASCTPPPPGRPAPGK